MKSIKRASVLLSGILAALATVTAYSAADRETVPVDTTAAPAVVPTEDPAVAATLGSGIIDYCPPGYFLVGNRLCLSSSFYGPAQYTEAQYNCMNGAYGGRVANIEDYHYTWHKTGNNRLTLGIWLGPRTGDDRALYCNYNIYCSVPTAHPYNIDGEANVFDYRYYRCALGPNWY
jgi:hypothetical protein